MAARTVVFDLDGTLLDTLEDLWRSVNHALAWAGEPARTRDDVRLFVGNGIRMLVARSLGEGRGGVGAQDPARVDAVLAEFSRHYAAHAADHTAPYPGVPELLAQLREAGVGLAVVSNKADFAVQSLVELHFPGCFDAVLGEDEAHGIRKKPAPDMVEGALARLGRGREGLVYVGDSEVDLLTAEAAGCPCVACAWGFRGRARLAELGADPIVDNPSELARVLLG